jgi:hypothetical protein
MTLARVKKALARRRRGAVALVAVAAMVPVAGMLTASMNSSQMVDDRRATQDAADAVARMHGAWSARGLNIIAMNSVTETQLLTVALGAEALNGTLAEQQIAVILAGGHIASHAAQKCRPKFKFDPWPIVCGVWHGVAAIPAIKAQVTLLDIRSDYDPVHGIETARRGLTAIEGMNRALLARHPRAMREIGEDYAELLEVDAFHFDDPCASDLSENCQGGRTQDGMSLPLEEGDAGTDFARCVAMETGTMLRRTGFGARGFDIGQGPLDHDGSTGVRDFINDETGVGEMLHDFKDAYDNGFFASRLPHYWNSFATIGTPTGADALGDDILDLVDGLEDAGVGVERDEDGNVIGDAAGAIGAAQDATGGVEGALEGLDIGSAAGWTKHPDWANLLGPQEETDDNAFTRRFTAKFVHLCFASGIPGPGQLAELGVSMPAGPDGTGGLGALGNLPELPDIPGLPEMPGLSDLSDALSSVELPDFLKGITPFLESPRPTTWRLPGVAPLVQFPPLVEPHQMEEEFHILAFAQRERSRRVGGNVFTDPGEPHNAYGQTGLFNPDGADVYSGNWRYRLMEGSRLDRPGETAGRMRTRAPADFQGLVRVLQGVDGQTGWERIHAH